MIQKQQLHLYLITDEASRCRHALLDTVRMAVEGGVTLVQYRCKGSSSAQRLHEARALKILLDKMGIALIINDDIHLALELDAAGLHIGQKDMPISEARRLLGAHKILGLTVNNAAQLKEVETSLVDYLGIGPVFPTISKKNPAPTLGIDGIRVLTQASALPVVAIGGITAKDAPTLRNEAKVAGIAVISAICAASDPRAAAQAFL